MKNSFKLIFFVTLPFMFLGCSNTPIQAEKTHYTEVLYTCERGGETLVHFYKQKDIAMLIHNKDIIELKREASASGFFYTNYKTSIRGKGNEMSLLIGRMAPIKCYIQS